MDVIRPVLHNNCGRSSVDHPARPGRPGHISGASATAESNPEQKNERFFHNCFLQTHEGLFIPFVAEGA